MVTHWIILSSIAVSALATPPDGPAEPAPRNPLPGWFLGAWERESIRRGDAIDTSVTVRYVQTPTMFGDLRIPQGRRRLPHDASWGDLAAEDLATLAQQEGFFGVTSIAGDVATWDHEIDYQPPDAHEDRGRLERLGSSMYEHGLDGSYTEHWWPLGSGDERYLVVRVTKTTQGVRRLERALLVAGNHFAYARNRSRNLPRAGSLAELIAASHAPRQSVVEYLDCELSQGRVRGGRVPWEIEYSTLPWREGVRLEIPGLISADEAGRLSAHGLGDETWTFPVNTLSREDLFVLFPPPSH